MPVEMKGRRIPVVADGLNSFCANAEPGDYYGPIVGYTAGASAVFFLLPIAKDSDVDDLARCFHHVQSPRHVFTEEPNGSLTIRDSIGAGPSPYYWHGFLTEGKWELKPSKP